MALAWENNPNGICEDAPCCGCCGPNGDGQYDPDEPPEYDDYYDGQADAMHEAYMDSLNEYDEECAEGGERMVIGEIPDPYWMDDK